MLSLPLPATDIKRDRVTLSVLSSVLLLTCSGGGRFFRLSGFGSGLRLCIAAPVLVPLLSWSVFSGAGGRVCGGRCLSCLVFRGTGDLHQTARLTVCLVACGGAKVVRVSIPPY